MSILLIHGAGYTTDEARRFLHRQRLVSGLTAGFVAAKHLPGTVAVNEGLRNAPFGIRVTEYSHTLNRPDRDEVVELPPVVAQLDRRTKELPRLRCLCCPTRSRPTTNARNWIGTAATDITGVTWSVIKRRMPDVYEYVGRRRGRNAALATVIAELIQGPRVVVAHSLGSVVAIDALSRIEPEMAPELLVTIGSPLPLKAIHDRLDAGTVDWIHGRRVAWINVYDRGDLATGGGGLPRGDFPYVTNLSVHNRNHSHDADYYLRHGVVGAIIWDVARGALDAAELDEGLPEPYREHVKYA